MDMRNYRSFFRKAGAALAGVAFFAACGKDDPVVDSGTTGDCAWTLTGKPGDYTLAISGEGAVRDYIFPNRAPWSQYQDEIKTAIVGGGVTAVGKDIFILCYGLTAIHVDAANTRYSSGDGVLFDKARETLLYYPGGKTGSYVIPGSVTVIDDNAFACCVGLTGVTIPGSVTEIGEWAFQACVDLTSVTIPNSVTTVGAFAFAECGSLGEVTIGRSVAMIGAHIFLECDGLTTIVNLNPVPQEFDGPVFSVVELEACTLKVLAGSVEAYKAAPGWKGFKTIVAI
jgi:hypothetical protein